MSCEDNCAQCRAYPCTCSNNYWILRSGVNMLKGCECDPNNPIRLQECFILYALQISTKARHDFNVLWPALFPCERERLGLLIHDNPMQSRLVEDVIRNSDRFQARMNRGPIYTVGPLGGRRLPLGRVAQNLPLPPHLAPRRQPTKCR